MNKTNARKWGPQWSIENTERPITIEEGTNMLVGTEGKGILNAFNRFKTGERKKYKVPDLWDGKTAKRIIRHLLGHWQA